MVPTLENDVRKLQEDGDALYDIIMETHRGVSSLGVKLAEFQRTTDMNFGEVRTDIRGLRTEMHDFKRETADNFAGVRAEIGGFRTEMHEQIGGLRTEMLDEISDLRETVGTIKTGVTFLRADTGQQERRTDKLNGRLDRLEGKSDKQSKQLDLIIRHLGISEE